MSVLRPLYGYWLQCTRSRRGLPWSVNGEEIRIHPAVRHLVPRIAEPQLFDYLRRHIQPGQVVLDIGSFLGIYAVFIARWVGPKGKVFLFEPTPANLPFINCHLKYNAVCDRVRVFPMAVGEREGTVDFTLCEEPYLNGIAGQGPTGGNRIEVSVVTMDRICEEFDLKPDWVRMDVQGHELSVLKGARRTIQSNQDRIQIAAELHPQLWPELGIQRQQAEALFGDLGLECKNLIPGEPPFLPDAHVLLRNPAFLDKLN